MERIERLVRATAVALAGAAVLVGGTQAAERPDDQGGMLGVGGVGRVVVEPSGVFERAVARHVAETLPDPFARGAGAVRPDDRSGVRGPGIVAVSVPAPVEVESGEGFAWGDVALGVGVMSALLVALGAVAAVTVRHRGRPLAR